MSPIESLDKFQSFMLVNPVKATGLNTPFEDNGVIRNKGITQFSEHLLLVMKHKTERRQLQIVRAKAELTELQTKKKKTPKHTQFYVN